MTRTELRPGQQYVSAAQVAAALHVAPMTVYRLIERGELPAVKVGRSVRIHVDDVQAFLTASRITAGRAS